MIKNFRKLLDFIKTEKILKYELKKYNQHIREFPNLARLAFDEIGLRASLYGRVENDELKILEYKVFNKIDCGNSTCLDIGANIGNHSVFFANFFSKVECFEPHPDNYYLLKFNTRKFKNVRVFNFGASDVNETKDIYIAKKTDMGRNSLLIERAEEKNVQKIKVELKNLDNFLKENKEKKIKFIKIDIEGYEYKALVGLENTLSNDSPIIAIEQWTDQFDESKKISPSIDFMQKNNYNFFYEPIFFKRKKGKNKIIRAINKIIFFLQIIFKSNKINLCKLKKIEKFEVRPYPMIIASKVELNS